MGSSPVTNRFDIPVMFDLPVSVKDLILASAAANRVSSSKIRILNNQNKYSTDGASRLGRDRVVLACSDERTNPAETVRLRLDTDQHWHCANRKTAQFLTKRRTFEKFPFLRTGSIQRSGLIFFSFL